MNTGIRVTIATIPSSFMWGSYRLPPNKLSNWKNRCWVSSSRWPDREG